MDPFGKGKRRKFVGQWTYFSYALVSVLLFSGCATKSKTIRRPLEGRNDLEQFYRNEAEVSPINTCTPKFADGGPAIRDSLLRLINKADDYILVDSFLILDGDVAGGVLQALARAHQRGVRVYVIGDDSSRFVGETPGFGFLRKSGIPIVVFSPYVPDGLFFQENPFERDHRKFWIIDGETLLFGGANLNNQSLKPTEEGGNRDLMVEVRSSQAVQQMVDSFLREWEECDGRPALHRSDFEVVDHSPTTTTFWLFDQSDPSSTEGSIKTMIEGLLCSAKKEVWLIQPYTFVTRDIRSTLKRLNSRGVKVNLVLSQKTFRPRFKYASHFGIPSLLSNGVQVWIYDSSTVPLHYKSVMIDNSLVAIGSANMNFRSYHLSREMAGVFHDPRSLESARRTFTDVINNSTPVTGKEANNYRTPIHLFWWLVMLPGG